MSREPGIWFPAIETGTGTDVFTKELVHELKKRGLKAEITWLPKRAEYAPWTVPRPVAPEWANIVHVNTWLPKRFLPKELPIVATCHLCVHDSALQPYKGALRSIYHSAWVKKVERSTIHTASRLTAVSKYSACQTEAVFQRKADRVIYNWVDAGRFKGRETKSAHEPFRLLYVGSMHKRKGIDLLVPILRQLGAGFELYVTGDSAELPQNQPPQPNLIFVGKVSDPDVLTNLYRQCDALLFPTRLEGFGLVAIEAQSSGLPVIASRNSSLPEVVRDGETGFLCETDNVSQFVEAIRTLSKNSGLYHKMSKNAGDFVEERFSANKPVSDYIMLYKSVLRDNR